MQLIEETKKTIVSSIPTLDESAGTETVSRDATLQESAPSPNNLPTLIDQGITSEALSITKKGEGTMSSLKDIQSLEKLKDYRYSTIRKSYRKNMTISTKYKHMDQNR